MDVGLGADLKEAMTSDQPLISQVIKGLTAKVQLCLLSNFKSAILDLLKDDEHQKIASSLFTISPALLLQIGGSVNVQFDDYNEIKDHPVFAPLMANFNELFEGMLENNPEELIERRFDLEGKEDTEGKSPHYKQLICVVKGYNTCMDALKNLGGTVELDICLPDYAATVRLSLKGTAVGKVLTLLMSHLFFDKLNEELEDE